MRDFDADVNYITGADWEDWKRTCGVLYDKQVPVERKGKSYSGLDWIRDWIRNLYISGSLSGKFKGQDDRTLATVVWAHYETGWGGPLSWLSKGWIEGRRGRSRLKMTSDQEVQRDLAACRINGTLAEVRRTWKTVIRWPDPATCEGKGLISVWKAATAKIRQCVVCLKDGSNPTLYAWTILSNGA